MRTNLGGVGRDEEKKETFTFFFIAPKSCFIYTGFDKSTLSLLQLIPHKT